MRHSGCRTSSHRTVAMVVRRDLPSCGGPNTPSRTDSPASIASTASTTARSMATSSGVSLVVSGSTLCASTPGVG
jgi:hypothetical protein